MTEYTQGICDDGAAILADGHPITIEKILLALRTLEEIKDWDINNKMKQGQFLLSQKIRSKIQMVNEEKP